VKYKKDLEEHTKGSTNQPGMSDTVLYHEEMHNAVLSWIKDWCEIPNVWRGKERDPQIVLRELVEKIDTSMESEKPFVIDGGEQELSDTHGFSTFICEKGQQLYDREVQEKMTWINMKNILKFYMLDIEVYIRRVNELGFNRGQIIEKFELNLPLGTSSRIADVQIDLDYRDPLTSTGQKLKNALIWSRYLTGTTIWEGDELEPNLLAGGEPYWSDCIVHGLHFLNRTRYHIFEGTSEEDTEQQTKKNDVIRKIQETLDEVKEDIGDGLYLELMNIMKGHYVVSE